MEVIEVNVGKKLEYSTYKNKITFEDELTLNCEKREQDFDVCIDICIDKDDMLTVGTLGEKYAAQIEIPARKYEETTEKNPDYDEKDDQSREFIVKRTPVPFSMANVTLKLYSIE